MAATDALPPAAGETNAARRARLFHETPSEILERWALGAAWAVKPARLGGLPALAGLWLGDLVAGSGALPDPARARDDPYGLAGICHDLSVETLVAAHRAGLYPFAHCGPTKWWSPPERCVLFFEQFHIGKRLRRMLRQGRYTVTFDTAFDDVIKACAGRREGKWHVTWVTPKIMRAYAALFDAGHAHSFEVWNEAGELAGGGYGVALGRYFVTESQFSREDNTSKLGFTVLNWQLARWGFALNDGKLPTPTITEMGFRPIPRADFLTRLAVAAAEPAVPAPWRFDGDLAAVAGWQPGDEAAPTLPVAA